MWNILRIHLSWSSTSLLETWNFMRERLSSSLSLAACSLMLVAWGLMLVAWSLRTCSLFRFYIKPQLGRYTAIQTYGPKWPSHGDGAHCAHLKWWIRFFCRAWPAAAASRPWDYACTRTPRNSTHPTSARVYPTISHTIHNVKYFLLEWFLESF